MTPEQLHRIAALVNMPLDRLRRIAGSGIDGRYSPTDAKAELGELYYDKGNLIAYILANEFPSVEPD